MQKLSKFAVVLCMLTVSVGAFAQDTESILEQIPAGSYGYFVINDINASCTRIEGLLNEMNLGMMLGLPPQPAQNGQPSMLVTMLKQQLMLGEGFNHNGGFAAVVLDPQKFGFDLVKMMETDGAEGAPENAKFPFVLFVPGSSIEGVFGNYAITQEGDLKKVALRMGEMYATQKSGHVILSPNADAVKAVAQAKGNTTSELTDDELAMINRNGMAYRLNLKTMAPVVTKFFEMMKEQTGVDPEMAAVMNLYTKIYGNLINDMDAVTVAFRREEKGLLFEEIVTAKPGSTMGKMFSAQASMKGAGLEVLNSLPSKPYVLAAGFSGYEHSDAQSMLTTQILDAIMTSDDLGISETTKQEINDVVKELSEQITGLQFVLGGPADQGVFGVSVVLKCKDASRIRQLLKNKTARIQDALAQCTDEGARQTSVTFQEGVDSVDGVKVDAISISSVKMLSMTDETRETLTKVMGEDKIRLFAAQTDSNTLVMTIGGSTAFLAEAVKASKGNGPLPKDADIQAAIQMLPKNCHSIGVLNIKNMMDLIKAGMSKFDLGPEAAMVQMIQMNNTTPIAFGSTAKENSVHAACFVPSGLFMDLANLFMTMAMQGGGGMGGF